MEAPSKVLVGIPKFWVFNFHRPTLAQNMNVNQAIVLYHHWPLVHGSGNFHKWTQKLAHNHDLSRGWPLKSQTQKILAHPTKEAIPVLSVSLKHKENKI